MQKWTKAQHAKYKATMKAKRAARLEAGEHFPLDAIPERAVHVPRGRPTKNGRTLHFEVKAGSEIAVALGDYRIEIKATR